MALKIEHRLGVRASSDRLWELVSELQNWEHWNPVHPGASGRIGYGETLRICEAYPHEERRTIEVKVHDWAPREQLVWAQKGFLWSSLRYLEIEELGPESCIFSNGVLYEGYFAKSELKKRGRAFKLGFGILGEAIKEKAERTV
ncbi:MAG: SRPBCC domain-containing protein [Caulobacteraceae bacterium]|nr:SRPBCC domain-containing protein [Caulobacteraceae bacterium]